jgi:hypothetical protein
MGWQSRNFSWITLGIRILCNNKRNLYLRTKKEENPSLKDYYNKQGPDFDDMSSFFLYAVNVAFNY